MDRREFIAASAGLALTPLVGAATNPVPTTPPRLVEFLTSVPTTPGGWGVRSSDWFALPHVAPMFQRLENFFVQGTPGSFDKVTKTSDLRRDGYLLPDEFELAMLWGASSSNLGLRIQLCNPYVDAQVFCTKLYHSRPQLTTSWFRQSEHRLCFGPLTQNNGRGSIILGEANYSGEVDRIVIEVQHSFFCRLPLSCPTNTRL